MYQDFVLAMMNFGTNREEKFFGPKLRLGMFLLMLFFQGFQPGCFYKRCFY